MSGPTFWKKKNPKPPFATCHWTSARDTSSQYPNILKYPNIDFSFILAPFSLTLSRYLSSTSDSLPILSHSLPSFLNILSSLSLILPQFVVTLFQFSLKFLPIHFHTLSVLFQFSCNSVSFSLSLACFLSPIFPFSFNSLSVLSRPSNSLSILFHSLVILHQFSLILSQVPASSCRT